MKYMPGWMKNAAQEKMMTRKILMARSKHKNSNSFAGIPRHIIEHKSYKDIGFSAQTLLTLLAYQYKGNNNGNLITRHESLPTKEVLKELGDDYYAYLISAIVNHCKADSHHFDDALRNLLRSI